MGFESCKYNVRKLSEILNLDIGTVTDALAKCRIGGFAKVWSVGETKEVTLPNGETVCYCTAKVSTGKRKEDGTYDNDFQDGFVTLGNAACKKLMENGYDIPPNGLSIQIVSCTTKNKYDKKTNKTYTNFTIYDFDIAEYKNQEQSKSESYSAKKPNKTATKTKYVAPEDDDPQLPF